MLMKFPAGSQYTYEYETVDHPTFLRIAEKKLGKSVDSLSTATILEQLRTAPATKTAALAAPEPSTSIVLLSPAPIGVGGGWHHSQSRVSDGSGSQAAASRPGKRGPEASEDSASKRARVDPVENTDTESGTDNEPIAVTRAIRPSTPNSSARTRPTNRPPSSPLRLLYPPTPTDQPRPSLPSRERTATTVLDSQPTAPASRSHSLGGSLSHYGDPLPPMPDLSAPVRGPTHARLRSKALQRVLDGLVSGFEQEDRDEEERERGGANGGERGGSKKGAKGGAEGSRGQGRCDGNDASEDVDSGPTPATTCNPRTYGDCRSHLASSSAPQARVSNPPSTSATNRASKSTSKPSKTKPSKTKPTKTKSKRATVETDDEGTDDDLHPTTRAPVPFNSRVARSLIGAATHPERSPSPVAPFKRSNRRLDPVSAAQEDMMAFNDDVARGNVESFVQSVKRQGRRLEDERINRAALVRRPRRLEDLLSDHEELMEEAEARANKRAMGSRGPAGPGRKRKRTPKPLARDYSGHRGMVLALAKLHLFAYALVEGIYQTRLTFLLWAEEIHYYTWMMLLPKVKYQPASQKELAIMVNYIATLRGKVKDRLRSLVAHIHGFEHCVETQQEMQENIDIFHTNYSPREGHFENPNVARCLGAGLFYGPGSVGRQFAFYFKKRMPFQVVAFILAIWQFCLEEWQPGYWESRDLGASHMRDKYEAHLAGLMDLEDIAPDRALELQEDWWEYANKYSGASRRRHSPPAPEIPSLRLEIRPDSPRPEGQPRTRRQRFNLPDFEEREPRERSLDLEEVDMQLMKEARIASLKQLAAERGNLTDDEDFDARTERTRSPSPPPPVEYNAYGCGTARSKGKGRAR
ncbi:hypothetical protein FRC09_008495 [Ceratobasidium sp. 395]|nr:hypothetical protein FRC09_008495 [Ceratobasidium sp. 395]